MAQQGSALSASPYGILEKFDSESMNIVVYLEQFSAYCTTWGIDPSKKVNLFISLIGHDLYRPTLLRDLTAPASVQDKNFDDLTKLSVNHFEAHKNLLVERYKFHAMKQAEDFVMNLKKQATKCEYGDMLEEMIRDQLVTEIYQESTRKRLLANSKLTLQQAIDTLVIEEQAEKDVKYFRPKFSTNNDCFTVRNESYFSGFVLTSPLIITNQRIQNQCVLTCAIIVGVCILGMIDVLPPTPSAGDVFVEGCGKMYVIVDTNNFHLRVPEDNKLLDETGIVIDDCLGFSSETENDYSILREITLNNHSVPVAPQIIVCGWGASIGVIDGYIWIYDPQIQDLAKGYSAILSSVNFDEVSFYPV